MRWGVVQDGVVVQVIAWDGVSPYVPPAGCELFQHDGVNVGWLLVDGVLVEPEPEVVVEPVPVEPEPAVEPEPEV